MELPLFPCTSYVTSGRSGYELRSEVEGNVLNVVEQKEGPMKHIGIIIVSTFLISFISGPASAQQDLVETITRDCKGEILRYCVSVSPGQSRLLACLYAHSDKLSSSCGYALIDGSPQLARTITNLTFAANECRDELKAYCSTIRPGAGRLLNCLEENKEKISERCREALKAGGFKEF